MSWTLIIGLIIAGLFLLVLEVMVIPGVGVVGFIGFGMIIFSIYKSFADHGAVAGTVVVVTSLAASVALIWVMLRSKTWKKISLNTELPGKVNIVSTDELKVGDKGVTIGRISPMGKVRIDGKYYEVKSGGAFIDPDVKIVVTRIEGSDIYVKEIE